MISVEVTGTLSKNFLVEAFKRVLFMLLIKNKSVGWNAIFKN